MLDDDQAVSMIALAVALLVIGVPVLALVLRLRGGDELVAGGSDGTQLLGRGWRRRRRRSRAA